MLKIALCDDVQDDREKVLYALTHIEEKLEEKFEIYTFSSGEKLCEDLNANNYDIILLDILMDGIDGIETARMIRNSGSESFIIFISSYDERLRELFGFNTIAFLDKPVCGLELEDAIRKCLDLLSKNEENLFTYKKNGSIMYMPMKEIVYFEAALNHVIIHTTKDEIEVTELFKNIWSKISKQKNFIKTSRSFIFNLKYISLKSNAVILKTDKSEFNVGRTYKKECLERYYKYLDERSV